MWTELIEDLLKAGLTEGEIVDRLKGQGVDTTQATINRLKNGKIKDTGYELGDALKNLHRVVHRKRRGSDAHERAA